MENDSTKKINLKKNNKDTNEEIEKLKQQAFEAYQNKQYQNAIDICQTILKKKSKHSVILHLLGINYHLLDDNEKAQQTLQQALQLSPSDPTLINSMGIVLKEKGESKHALNFFNQALALNPNLAEAHNNIGLILQEQENFPDAIKAYKKSLEINPNYIDAYLNLGNTYLQGNDYQEANYYYKKILSMQPNHIPALNHLACALLKSGKPEEAIAMCQRAFAIDPNDLPTHNTLALILKSQYQYDQAIKLFKKALSINPNYFEVTANLAETLERTGAITEAISYYRTALTLRPDFTDIGHNLGFALLKAGQFKEGWEKYEYRWLKSGADFDKRNTGKPLWNGELLTKDQRLYVHFEQGFGDTIQFARYLPLVKEKNNNVHLIFECQPHLKKLFQNFPSIDELFIPEGKIPEHDFHIPLLSLPRIMETTLRNIPTPSSFLSPDPKKLKSWQEKMNAYPGFKIGISWAGNPNHANEALRSCELTDFLSLFTIPNTHFFSLQKRPRNRDIQQLPNNIHVIDLDDAMEDFVDTAAIMSSLDLIITIDTVIAHLAAALGKPIWNLLCYYTDWRWMLDRNDSPWYSSMRLFRQNENRKWDDVFKDVKKELLKILEKC